MTPEELKQSILAQVREFHRAAHGTKPFHPGRTLVNYAGRVYGPEELVNTVDAALEFYLTASRYASQLEEKLRSFFGARRALLVNSGSSANLLMVAALKSSKLARPLREGDEVITPAVTFPTTLAPIVQNGLVPVFVDCEPDTFNLDPEQVAAAISPKTKAIFAPHTLGSPWHLATLSELCRERDLYLLEDCCDALGATYDGRPAGSFGAMSSLSFFPAHQMTMGEGGAVIVNDNDLVRPARSIRDWGKDCWCEPGRNDSCTKRFGGQYGDLPFGYDHKYVFSDIGYNLKVTDLQAAIGVAQWERVPGFVEARRANYTFYRQALEPFADKLAFARLDPRANPSWFGFPVTVRRGVERAKLVRFLEQQKVETRLMFGGNILKQPGYRNIRHRVAGRLTESDRVLRDSFFIGVYPGLTEEQRQYVVAQFTRFLQGAV